MRKLLLFPIIFVSIEISSAQPAPDINCQSNVFYGINGTSINMLEKSGNTIVDLGSIAPTSFPTVNAVAFGNDITQGSANRTFYVTTGSNPCIISRYNGTAWDTITTDTIIYHNAGANGNFIYFQHSANNGGPNDCSIARLNSNGTLTTIFSDTSLRYTVADVAVDSIGNIYCFRGPQIGQTTELTVINPQGIIINSYSTTLNNLSTLFGSFFLNDTLYLGWNTTAGQIFPVLINGSTASLGQGILLPAGVSYKDLANCYPGEGISNITTNNQLHEILIKPNPASGYFILENNSGADLSITIHDCHGRKILSDAVNSTTYYVDITGWNAGIYFLQANNKNHIYTQKIFKY